MSKCEIASLYLLMPMVEILTSIFCDSLFDIRYSTTASKISGVIIAVA